MSYESPWFEKDEEAEVLALELLKRLDGMPVAMIRQVLRRAEFWLDATTALDCSATEYQKAFEEYRRVAEKSL